MIELVFLALAFLLSVFIASRQDPDLTALEERVRVLERTIGRVCALAPTRCFEYPYLILAVTVRRSPHLCEYQLEQKYRGYFVRFEPDVSLLNLSKALNEASEEQKQADATRENHMFFLQCEVERVRTDLGHRIDHWLPLAAQPDHENNVQEVLSACV